MLLQQQNANKNRKSFALIKYIMQWGIVMRYMIYI